METNKNPSRDRNDRGFPSMNPTAGGFTPSTFSPFEVPNSSGPSSTAANRSNSTDSNTSFDSQLNPSTDADFVNKLRNTTLMDLFSDDALPNMTPKSKLEQAFYLQPNFNTGASNAFFRDPKNHEAEKFDGIAGANPGFVQSGARGTYDAANNSANPASWTLRPTSGYGPLSSVTRAGPPTQFDRAPRLQPPIGTPATRLQPPIGTPATRIQPPIGTPATRLQPPIGTPVIRIHPPIGTPAPSRRDSVPTHDIVAHAISTLNLSCHIKSGATAPPGDLGVNNGVKDKPISPPEVQDAVRFVNSKMHGPSSVAQSVIDAARVRIQQEQPLPALPEKTEMPPWFLASIHTDFTPSTEEVLADIPFTDVCARATPNQNTSVLLIQGIPYATIVSEIVAFVGMHAQICKMPLGSRHYAVHIIMERDSGKTMDCYVELSGPREAAFVKQTLQKRCLQNRPVKLNNREVKIFVSSQAALMQKLFPRAKHVAWLGTRPVVDFNPRHYVQGQVANGFEGFLNPEEFVWMDKIAETGERALFASKAPTRVYEAMISILYKYPWSSTSLVYLKERRLIFDATVNTLRCLIIALARRYDTNRRQFYEGEPPKVTLLEQLVHTALSCPGFNERQKSSIVLQLRVHAYGELAKGYVGLELGGKLSSSFFWPFQSLGVNPGVHSDVTEFYIGLLRDMSMNPSDYVGWHVAHVEGKVVNPFGNFAVKYGDSPDQLTMQDAANMEMRTIKTAIRKYMSGFRSSQEDFPQHVWT